MRKAFADGIIEDEQLWIDLLNDRNATSHIYDEETAEQIFHRINTEYYKMWLESCFAGSSRFYIVFTLSPESHAFIYIQCVNRAF